jgi:hypothetical protein
MARVAAVLFDANSLTSSKEQPILHREPKKKGNSRPIIVALWITMLLSSLITIGMITETFLRPPASTELASSDWGGYTVTSDRINPSPVFRSVSASWTVPAVTISSVDTFSAVWIGIGGQLDGTLIQTGTEQDSIGGQASYSAWYELLPSDSTTIHTLSVSAGDEMSASIALVDPSSHRWSVQITDLTTEQSFNQTFFYVSSRLSAEWIVERPTVNKGLAALANFGIVDFRNTEASTDSKTGTVTDFPFSRITMIDRQNNPLVDVSSLMSQQSGFTVTFLD